MRILIKVTKEILEASKMCGADHGSIGNNCPIALAIRNIFPIAWVSGSSIQIDGNYFWQPESIMLPPIAVMFIMKFDKLKSKPKKRLLLHPISFEIDVPDSYIDSIGIEEVKDILSRSKTLELVNN